MIPALLGMGGWLAKVAAVSVIPKVVQALQSALAAPTPSEVSSPKPDSHVKYTFDQLGSVRELIDSSGVVRADYRYSTYGERTKVGGDLESDWGYAGLFHHVPSGLDLATFRIYDSKAGRWISREPLGEGVDYNLYRYCNNNPMNSVDPGGLKPSVVIGYGAGIKYREPYNFKNATTSHKPNLTKNQLGQILYGGSPPDALILNAHQWPYGIILDAPVDSHAPTQEEQFNVSAWLKRKRPRIVVLNGCMTSRSLPGGPAPKDSVIVYTDEMEDSGIPLAEFLHNFLPALDRGMTVNQAVKYAADNSPDSYIEQHFKVWGNGELKL